MRTLITLLILSLTSCSDIFVGDYSKYPQYRHHYTNQVMVSPVPVTEYLPGVGLITIYRYGNYVSVYNHSTGTYSSSLSIR